MVVVLGEPFRQLIARRLVGAVVLGEDIGIDEDGEAAVQRGERNVVQTGVQLRGGPRPVGRADGMHDLAPAPGETDAVVGEALLDLLFQALQQTRSPDTLHKG